MEQIDSSMTRFPEVTIPGTELRTFHSKILNQDLQIYVKFPLSYFKTTIAYPVLFSLDANLIFPLIANIASLLELPERSIPEIVFVSIGYKIKGMEDWFAWRTRDLTPTVREREEKWWQKWLSQMYNRDDFVVQTGGASKFLDVIRKELISFVESNYRVSSLDRGLLGYSYGGLFALYTLFQYPETFGRYFAGSPTIDYDEGVLFKFEERYASTHSDLKASVFMSVGSLEDDATIESMKKMVTRLQSRNFQNLKLESHIFDNENHESCVAAAIARGLRILYK
jgi:predicted alpha/beta superfamily hydrolase